MNALLAVFVGVMGAGLSVQPLINARVAQVAGHPIYAAMFSVFVSTLTLIVAATVLRLPVPDGGALAGLRPFLWCGGVIGAFVVLSALMAAPKLGAATTVALFIVGQLTASLVLDHFGFLGLAENPIDTKRILGALCLLVGVALIRFG